MLDALGLHEALVRGRADAAVGQGGRDHRLRLAGHLQGACLKDSMDSTKVSVPS